MKDKKTDIEDGEITEIEIPELTIVGADDEEPQQGEDVVDDLDDIAPASPPVQEIVAQEEPVAQERQQPHGLAVQDEMKAFQKHSKRGQFAHDLVKCMLTKVGAGINVRAAVKVAFEVVDSVNTEFNLYGEPTEQDTQRGLLIMEMAKVILVKEGVSAKTDVPKIVKKSIELVIVLQEGIDEGFNKDKAALNRSKYMH
jgi:hypothetical protein